MSSCPHFPGKSGNPGEVEHIDKRGVFIDGSGQCLSCKAWEKIKKESKMLLDNQVYIEANNCAKWLDNSIKKLIPSWAFSFARNKMIPDYCKEILIGKIFGVEIVVRQLMAGFGAEYIIKQHGKVKARRKFM